MTLMEGNSFSDAKDRLSQVCSSAPSSGLDSDVISRHTNRHLCVTGQYLSPSQILPDFNHYLGDQGCIPPDSNNQLRDRPAPPPVLGR